MAKTKETTVTVQPVESIGMFKALGIAFSATASIITITARTTEKAVGLVENEVDNLHLLQQKRIDESKAQLGITID